ncbi:hypothetical protein CH251_12475 [Rhodococcus sp. 06-462-5]|uniref:acyl-ACP thioesterase domain-containing protein n=1 Tax=Nocardiaceae TaxID=85025 RepID=UPI00050CBDBB|nr:MULTISPECIES: acyl-ACP thioesterase domain-containing protein [Rhodococcus]OZC73940.1 hypothetical protein CH251_12475 [Rhodococcus sp. 06-462-5]OZE67936.1 hypothetical protein CH270_09435 [Rhodococcus sp. 02-925g]OZF51057.1 hypothetical protein CH291_05545 [Rhodococcus sp. 14-1411-2a]
MSQSFEQLDRPDTARSFVKQYRMGVGDADPQGQVRLDAIARLLQDVALDMIHESGFLDEDPFWIVRRNVIDVIRPLTWPGEVKVERWCAATSSRWVSMRQRLTGIPTASPFNPGYRQPGLVETESFCINVTRRGLPARISDATLDAWSTGITETRLRWRPVNPPAPAHDSEFTESRPFALRATDFDFFEHMNNVAYWPPIERALRQHPAITAHPHRAVIEYLKPVRYRASLDTRWVANDNGFTVWFLADGVVTTTATVRRL